MRYHDFTQRLLVIFFMLGTGINTGDLDVKTLTFDWSIANNVSQEKVVATTTGVASSIRSQYFPKRGTYSIGKGNVFCVHLRTH